MSLVGIRSLFSSLPILQILYVWFKKYLSIYTDQNERPQPSEKTWISPLLMFDFIFILSTYNSNFNIWKATGFKEIYLKSCQKIKLIIWNYNDGNPLNYICLSHSWVCVFVYVRVCVSVYLTLICDKKYSKIYM